MKILINDKIITSDIKGITISDNTIEFLDVSDELIILEGDTKIANLNITIRKGNVTLLKNDLDINLNVEVLNNATLNLQEVNFSGKQEKHSVLVETSATFNHTIISMSDIDLNLNIDLNNLHANTFVDCLVIGDNTKNNLNILINHNAKNTKSVVKNHAIGLSNTVVDFKTSAKVNHGSVQSSCRQTTKGLILNENSVIKSTPILLIDENDIEASHGTTIGKVSDDSLFYLMSRGLTQADALKLVIMGLISPFIEIIKEENIKEKLINQISHYLER